MGLTPDWHCLVPVAASCCTSGDSRASSARFQPGPAVPSWKGPMPKENGLLRPTDEALRDIPGCHGVSQCMMWLSSIIQPATREGTLGVPCVPALEDAHFGVAAHLWGPFPACTVGYNALKAIQPPQKNTGMGQGIITLG